ncbi:hypothetical protein OL548_33740 (plasmid) [Lysinibacillus sp. MHQ-1]|nr:hypothetical protein OL548_33740 [Lysinibacillus sp. MHQ-1]
MIESVIKSETTYQQADKDAALALVEQLPDDAPKDNLLQRLDAAQTVIDATAAVGNAETTLEEADQVTAQTLVNEINPGNTKKS